MHRDSPVSRKSNTGFSWARLCGLMAAMVVIAGGAAMLWLTRAEDASMRSELLVQARLVADTLDPRRIIHLTGSPSDLDSPDYQQIKSQLQLMRSANGKFRFIFLARQLPDGRVVFLVDSEPIDSKDLSPPGQVYDEATDGFRAVFATGRETVEGADSDRWGSWISALVPIRPTEGARPVAVLGIDVDARQWTWDIFQHCLPVVALCLLGLSALFFLAVLFRRSENARERIAASEALLAESEERYRIAAENSGQLIYDCDLASGKILWSGDIQSVVGYAPEEFVAVDVERRAGLIHADDRRLALGLLDQALLTGTPYRAHYRFRCKNGTYIHIADRAAFIPDDGGKAQRLIGAIQDVTQRKQAEEALRRSEESFRSLFGNMAEGVALHEVVLDASGRPSNYRIVDCNPQYERILGVKRAEVVSRLATEVHQVQDPPYLAEYGRVALSGLPAHMETFFEPMERHFDISIAPWGRNGFATIFTDVTGRKAAEAALKSSEQKYRTIIEGIQEGYVEFDLRGNLTFFNTALRRIAGLPAEELAGTNYRDFTTPETAEKMFQVFRRIYHTARPSGVEDFEILMRDGRRIAIDLTASPILSPDGSVIGFRGLFRDISERKRAERQQQELEEQLQRAQKMKAIGTLAGGVAHDLNNILSGIVSYPDLLLMDLPNASPLRKPIETIRDSGHKAAAIVQDLLTLARRGVSVSEVLNLNDIVQEHLKSPEFRKLESFHPHVSLDRRLDPGLMNIMGSPVHLLKTVMNLVSNAAEAMPEGGTITISTCNAYVDQPVRGYDQVTEGDYAVLAVSDSGVGIAPENLQRIFEPFFTKKKMGRSGTGLGMAVVWGTVKDHKGYIDVRSIEGEGTTFSLYFPVTRREKDVADSTSSIDRLQGRSERVLVVDDVNQQREIASAILSKLGYQVHTVPCGEEAVEYVKTHPVDLLILDMIMPPGIDGLETYRRVVEHRPGQKAIITSGYSETGRVSEAQRLGAGTYLRKPYTLENLGWAVKEELQRT